MADTALDIAIAAGGTAGHINPALALAEELTSRGHRVSFYGQSTRLEAELVPKAGYPFHSVEVSGFDRTRPWTLVTALAKMRGAEKQLAAHFAHAGAPDVAIGFGAYVELPLLRWCIKQDIPVLVHEQNSVVGLANRALAPKCARVCVSFPAATEAFVKTGTSRDRIVLTGNPVRKSVTDASREAGRAALGVDANNTVLLVFGGSLGARHLNSAIAACKDELLAREGLVVVHSTGAQDYEDCCEALALTPAESERWRVMPYIDDMGSMLAAADCIVSRAGASSIAEIAAVGVPSILVPYPQATEDHQTTNARYLVDAGAADIIADDRLDTAAFREKLLALVDSAELRARMREGAKTLAQKDAAANLANEVEKAAGRQL